MIILLWIWADFCPKMVHEMVQKVLEMSSKTSLFLCTITDFVLSMHYGSSNKWSDWNVLKTISAHALYYKLYYKPITLNDRQTSLGIKWIYGFRCCFSYCQSSLLPNFLITIFFNIVCIIFEGSQIHFAFCFCFLIKYLPMFYTNFSNLSIGP